MSHTTAVKRYFKKEESVCHYFSDDHKATQLKKSRVVYRIFRFEQNLHGSIAKCLVLLPDEVNGIAAIDLKVNRIGPQMRG